MLLKREIRQTSDGSTTIHIPEWNESYHSQHGAIQEALHVFIEAGLRLFERKNKVNILEIGFGTGLNAFLTAQFAKEMQLSVRYCGLEAFPVSETEAQYMNFANSTEEKALFLNLHQAPWNDWHEITPYFSLLKIEQKLNILEHEPEHFDLIYFDAFGPRVQPDLWTLEIFEKMFQLQKAGGVLVTYCSKGDVRRAMVAAGYQVEKLPGPPGKREMVRAFKKS